VLNPALEKSQELDAHLTESIETFKAAGTLASPFVKPETEKSMSITGLQQGAFQAKLAEMKQRIADSQVKALTHIESVVTEGAAQLEEAAKGAAAKAQREIDDALQEFAPSTNGGPA
jgi:methionyl-tRNA synthetase